MMKQSYLKIIQAFVIALCLMPAFTVFPVWSMMDIKEGQEFRRTKAGSPILLKFSSKVKVQNYGLDMERSGFNIYSYNEDVKQRKHLGYITFILDERRKAVDFTWVKINDSDQKRGYATEALQTAMSVLKLRHSTFFPWATHYWLSVGNSVGPAMKRVAIKQGFTVSTRFFHPGTMTDYEKPIVG